MEEEDFQAEELSDPKVQMEWFLMTKPDKGEVKEIAKVESEIEEDSEVVVSIVVSSRN